MANWMFGSIRQRLLASFVAIVLVFAVTVMITTSLLTRSLVGDLVEQNAQALVQSQGEMIRLWQQERVRELKQLANSSLLESLDWEQIEPFLQRQIRDSDEYYRIYFVATPDGDYNTTRHRSPSNIADRDYFSKVLAGETVISDPVISRSIDEKIVVIATPIWDEDGSSVIGVLGLSIGLAEIYPDMTKFQVGSDSQVFIVDQKGYFIAHSDPNLIMEARIQDYYPHWDRLGSARSGSFSYRHDGANFRSFFYKLSESDGWSVIVQIPAAFFTQPVKRLISYLLVLSAACFLLVLPLGSRFASTITEPIVELKEIFRRGAEGDLTVRAEVASADELGETRTSFNLMMDTIGTMTYYDPLTGLPNRQYFFDHLDNCLTEVPTVILALVSIREISEFKTLLGPDVTDDVLIRVATSLRTVSDDEVVVARIADAEFGVVIPSTANGVLQVIDRLDSLLTQPFHLESGDLNIRLVGGISISTSEQDNISAESFYQQAQTALYEAEHSSSEQLKLYDPNTHHAIVDRIRFQTEIRNALEREQFIVYYQPIVDLKTGSIVGKEALIRWMHPVRGLLSPVDFLEAAEQGGFIEEIGEYMLHRVCEQHQSWQGQSLALGWVAVNISANHFRSPHFPSLVQSVLQAYDAPSSLLRIEITEDAMLSPTTDVLQNFQELRKMGVHLAIDDFGTAYSTLDYLVRYPMETLKIDKAFISHVDVDLRIQGLVRSIIGMGQNLSMAIVAEGVERAEQLELLRQMGCTEAQGYLFSRPVPWEDYPQVALKLAQYLRKSDDLG